MERASRDDALLEIRDITTEGEGVATWPDGLVVFVPGALPGDRVRARLESRRARIGRARMLALEKPSVGRREPPCAYQERCGGCPLMPLAEERVLDLKARQVVETLRRLGGLELRLDARRASPAALRYRNRARFALERDGGGFRLGYRPRGEPRALVAVDECLLLPEGSVGIARRFVEGLGRCDLGDAPPTHLSLRGSLARDTWLVALHGPPGRWPGAASFAEAFLAREARVAGVVRVLERGARVLGTHVLAGEARVVETIAGRDVPLDATSFLQVNPRAADLLYEEVRSALGDPAGFERLLDLYCGVGLTALAATPAALSILGVEGHRRSARAAAELAAREGRRAEYVAGDAREALRALAAREERFDALIANPPRAGAGPELARHASRLGVRRAVLVSCHPATLARDARGFVEEGYAVARAAVVDLFPQTAEVETLLALSRGA